MRSSVASYIILFFFFCQIVVCQDQNYATEDMNLNFMGLAQKYGHPAEAYRVKTEDDYIITIHHIPGKGCPVLLQHGIVDSSDTFIIRGKKSLAITLAEAGYDVWLGNVRGNKYSRRHATMNPDTDKAYWYFSMHEMGYYDLPAMIDYILERTGQSELSAVGHSEGNAIFYVLGATRPEFNEKVKVIIALAPIAYIHNIKQPLRTLFDFAPQINAFLTTIGAEEMLSDNSTVRVLTNFVCTVLGLNYEICATGGFFIAGSDERELEPTFLDVLIQHFPTGTSRNNFLHVAQIGRAKRFQRLDYGRENNLKVYGAETPPEYDLEKVTMRVELLVGKNDKISTVEDVNILSKKLPNGKVTLMRHSKMNHMDFVWGRHMDKYLFPHVLQILDKNCK